MKNILFFFTFIGSAVFAQNTLSIPTCPEKVEFANVMVVLDAEAQKLVNTEITNLLTPPNKFLDQKLERMQWYFPIIEKVLESENVPDDLKYLSVMESALLPEAISTSNAVGFWQFKEPTAKENGLVINGSVDERKNIYFATKAAANYLKKNNLTLKNWVSTILSFNTGLQGSNQWVLTFWTNATEINFNKNTHEYLIRALAHRIAMEHRLNRIKDGEKRFVEYHTNSKTLAEIALELTSDLNELKKYNTWLNTSTIPADKLYPVLLLVKNTQAEELEATIKKRADLTPGIQTFPELKRLTAVSTGPDSPIFYTINSKKGILALPGDDVAQLATKSKMKIKKFLSINDLTEQNQVKEGKVYYLQKKNAKAKVPYHTVSVGQTMWDVAQMYGVKLKGIYAYNRMSKKEEPAPGRVLWLQKTRPKNTPIEYIKNVPSAPLPSKEIPELSKSDLPKEPIEKAKPKTEKPITMPTNTKKTEPLKEPLKVNDPIFEPKKTGISNANMYTVKQGETLFSVAKLFGLTVDELRNLNGLASDELILPGQKLKVLKESIYTPEPPKEKVVVKTEPKISETKPTEPVAKNTPNKVEEPSVPVTKPKPAETAATKPDNTLPKTLSETGKHTVQKGETAFSISRKYGMTVNELLSKNKKSNPTVELGEVLIVGKNVVNNEPKTIPAEPKPQPKPQIVPKAEPKSTPGSKYHIVASGETLYSISKKYGQTTDQVKIWNNMKDNTVVLGQKLIVGK